MNKPDKTARKQTTRFTKGQSGNPAGRPQGSRHKATEAALALMDGQLEAITQKAVDAALQGDLVAIRLILERLLPRAKERAMPRVKLPMITNTSDLPKLLTSISASLHSGQLTEAELSRLLQYADSALRIIQAQEADKMLILPLYAVNPYADDDPE